MGKGSLARMPGRPQPNPKRRAAPVRYRHRPTQEDVGKEPTGAKRLQGSCHRKGQNINCGQPLRTRQPGFYTTISRQVPTTNFQAQETHAKSEVPDVGQTFAK